MTAEERLQILLQKATAAVDRGANPAKVNAYLENWASKNGISGVTFNLHRTDEANAAPSFDNINSGVETSAPPNFANVEGGSESTAEPEFLDSAWAGLKGTGKKAVAGGLLALQGARSIVDPVGAAMDEDSLALQGASALQDSANEDLRGAHGWGGALGSLPAGIVGAPFLPGSAGMDAIDQGKSLTEAELQLGRQALITEGSVAAGLLGNQAKGFNAWLSRASKQVPAGVGLTAADRAMRGEEIMSTTDEAKREYILGIGGGLLGSAFRNPARPKAIEKPSFTGDADIDAGIADFKKVLNETPEKAPEKKPYNFEERLKAQENILADQKKPDQGDLFADQPVEQTSLFGENVPAELAESRRLSSERAALGEEPIRSEEQIRDLESDYILSQQERLNRGTQTEDMVSRRGDIPEAYLGIPKQDVLPEGKRTIFTRDGEPVGVKDIQPNTQMQRQMLLALADRGKLRNDPVPVPAEQPTQGTLFEPARNEVVEQVADQPDMFSGTQQDLQLPNPNPFEGFVQYQPKATGAIEQKITAKKAVEEAPSLDDLRSKVAKMKAGDTLDAPATITVSPFYEPASVPKTWDSATAGQSLTVGQVLDDVAKGAVPNLHPEIVNFAKYVQSLGKKFGGLDVAYKRFDDNDTGHAAYLANKALSSQKPGAAYFSLSDNVIRVNPEQQNIQIFLHEGTHAITARAIEAGKAGKLNKEGQLAFNRLNVLRKELTDLINERASSNDRIKARQTYGSTDTHEFIAELYTNPTFRQHLKSISIKDMEGRMSQDGIVKSSVIKNAYQAVVKNIRQLLGLPEKAESALDMAISSGHEFFSKADRNSVSGKGILEAPADSQPELRKARSKPVALARELLLSKGNVPEVNDATRSVQGAVNAARAKSTTVKNLVESQRSSVNPDDASAVLEGKDEDGSAMKRLREQSPDVAQAVSEFKKNRRANAIAIVEEKLADPNLTATDRKTLGVILNKANSYLTTTRSIDEIPNYGKDLWKKYKAGDEKAVDIVNRAKGYLTSRFLQPKLDTTKMDTLSELYQAHTGVNPDTQFAGVEPALKKELMRVRVAEQIEKVANTEQWLDNNIQALLGMTDVEKNSIARWYKQARLGSNVLSTKVKIPPALEKLWGKIEDPFFQMYRTIEEQASQLAQIKAQNILKDEGLKSGLFTDKPDTKSHSVQLSGESLGPLQGLYTTPDAADALNGVRAISGTASDLLAMSTADKSGELVTNAGARIAFNGVQKVAGLNKATTILGNVGNFPLNLAGSPMQLLSNGNINPKAMAAGIKTMSDLIGVGTKRKLSPAAERAFRLNLAEVSQTQELMNHPRSVELKKFLDEMAGQTNPIKWAADQGKQGLQLFKELYGAMDLWTKLANFENELSFWKTQKTGMTDEALERFVANRVNNSNITPSNSPLALRVAERTGATMFGTYYGQVLKNTGYNVAYGSKDLLDGIKSGNTALATHGFKRLAGVTTYMAGAKFLYTAGAKGLASILGLSVAEMASDDAKRKYMDTDDFLSGVDAVSLSDKNNPEAGEFLMDVGRPNPFGPAVQISTPFVKAIAAMSDGDEKEALRQANLVVKNAANLVNNNTIYKTAGKIVKGLEPSIAKTAPKAYNTEGVAGIEALSQQSLQANGLSKENADRVLNLVERFTPRTLLNIDKAKEIESDTVLKKLVAAGVGVTKFDVGKDIQTYLANGMKRDVTSARKTYMDILKSDVPVNKERITEAFADGMKELVKPYRKMEAAVEAAKAQGLGKTEIAIKMVNGGLSKEIAGMFYQGEAVPIALILGDPVQELKKQIAEAPENKQQELIDRAAKKMEILSELFEQYEDVTLEDLENM